ncbi:MAG: hypothetical protein ACFE0R_07525, partial [Salinarimonas sp.]
MASAGGCRETGLHLVERVHQVHRVGQLRQLAGEGVAIPGLEVGEQARAVRLEARMRRLALARGAVSIELDQQDDELYGARGRLPRRQRPAQPHLPGLDQR